VNWCFDRRFSWTVQRLESEIQFERELDDPTIAGGENSSKCGRFPPDIRWTKIRMIECIEELGSELEEAILIHVDVLRNREIEVCQAWASHDANAGLLLRSPDFAVVVIVTMTLGIGANTAIFSLVHEVILRPFSYPKPDCPCGSRKIVPPASCRRTGSHRWPDFRADVAMWAIDSSIAGFS
jgi:hypothetical protein